MSQAAETHTPIAERARQFAPVVWLLGKVQSGKTSIVRELTQATTPRSAMVTRPARRRRACSIFPARRRSSASSTRAAWARSPTIPSEDIAFCEGRSHLILAVVKARDFQQQAVIEAIAGSAQAPSGLAGGGGADQPARGLPAGRGPRSALSVRLRGACGRAGAGRAARALTHQRTLFSAMPGKGELRFVPIDFTQAGDGFEPHDYGREALVESLVAAAPAAVATVSPSSAPHGDSAQRNLNTHILGFAFAAGASDAFPLAGIVGVPVVQAAMLRHIGLRAA